MCLDTSSSPKLCLAWTAMESWSWLLTSSSSCHHHHRYHHHLQTSCWPKLCLVWTVMRSLVELTGQLLWQVPVQGTILFCFVVGWILIFPTSRLPPWWAILRWGILISRYINIAHPGYNTFFKHVSPYDAFRRVQNQCLILFLSDPIPIISKPCYSLSPPLTHVLVDLIDVTLAC